MAHMARTTRQSFKLRDLVDSEVAISEWSLETPRVQYTASSAHYGRQSGGAMIHFAQVIIETPMNALAVAMPHASIREALLPNLGPIRERIKRLEEEGRIEEVPTVPPEQLTQLERQSYVQKAADRVRVAINDHFSIMDFYKLPALPPALIAAQPNKDLEIDDVVRVLMPTAVFRTLIEQMEQVESYEPAMEESNEQEDESFSD